MRHLSSPHIRRCVPILSSGRRARGGAFGGYIPSKRRYFFFFFFFFFYGLRVHTHLVLTRAGEPVVEFSLVAGSSEADVKVLKELNLDLCPKAPPSWPTHTRPTPTM